jgi:hypothetical protein
MRNASVGRGAAASLIVLIIGAWTANAYAQRSFGTNVDNFCISQGTVAPIQGDCSVCHAGSYSASVEPEWSWYLNGQTSTNGWINFCGPIVTNGPPDGIIVSPASDQGIAQGAAVNFRGSATDPDGDPVSYSWAFPGGIPSISSVQNPGNVTYATAGTYTATLVVSDNSGNSDATPATRVITVQSGLPANTPPNGTITAPSSNVRVIQGESVIFTGSGVDAEGDALSFRWDFGGAAADASVQNPGQVQLNVVGTFAVRLIVADSRGEADPTPDVRTVIVEPEVSTGPTCGDADGDLFSPEGGICGPADCSDENAAVNPGAVELCGDGIDNDCDGLTDDADGECDGSDCIGVLLSEGGGVPSLALQYSQEADRDPASTLEGAVVSGNLHVFIPSVSGIVRVRYYLDGELSQTENLAPWDFAGGSASAANPLDSRTLTDGTHEIVAEVVLDTGQTVAVQAGFVVNNGAAEGVEITRASWSPSERELEVEGPWHSAGASVTLTNAETGMVLATTTVRYDDGRLGYELELEGLTGVPCRVRVEIAGRYGERDVANAPADCVGGGTSPPTNRSPVAGDDSASTDEDVGISISVLGNDSDPDGDPLTLESIGAATAGSVRQVGGSLLYTPSFNWFGVDSFTYRVVDGRGGSDTATVTVTVRGVNDPPIAIDDTATTTYETPVTVAVLANDSDVERDGLSVTQVSPGANGRTSIDGVGVVYVPNSGFSGADSFTYTVSDGQGGNAGATVTVQVQSPPPPPALSVRFSELRWSAGDRKLTGKGSGAPSRVTLSILDADTGSLLGRVRTSKDGRFELEMRLRAAPCRIRVRYQTQLSLAFPVGGSPCQGQWGDDDEVSD